MGNIIVTSEETLKAIVKECFDEYARQHPQFQQQGQQVQPEQQQNSSKFSPLYNCKEAAEYLKVSTKTINRLVKAGELQPVKVGGNKFEIEELNRYKKKKTY